jgi:dTDP-4-amino-4,6-dideoxygalactose transaminase
MIPFLDLKSQFNSIAPELEAAALGVLRSGRYVLGNEGSSLEAEFAAYTSTKHAVAVNTGTSALHLAMLANRIGPGDEVITVPMTFVATVASILYAGARPVFVDIDPSTYTMDVRQIEKAITPRTRAIVPVHLYGQTADMDPILDVARRHKLVVIEDAAQAHGATYKGRPAGSMGDCGCFSFYPGKNLGACGEGGMLVTNNPDLQKTVRMLRDWGQEKRYHHVMLGFNYRLDEIQSALLRVKLRYLERWTEARRKAAALYDRLFDGTGVRVEKVGANNRHVYHIYAVRSPRRDAWQVQLRERGIDTGIHYPIPVHMQQGYDLGYAEADFPHAEQVGREELSLPIYPELPEASIRRIAEEVIALQKAEK